MAKILVVEDDTQIAEVIRSSLELEGHIVKVIHHGIEAQQFILAHPADLIILDWDLPGLSGLEILKDFRAFGGQGPVLMLTGHSAVEDKEHGFDSGADDYLTKPFNLRELGARVRSLLRRSQTTIGNVITVGDIVVDLDTSKVMKSGRAVTLMPREFQLLAYLVKAREVPSDLTQLLSSVWSSDSEMTPDSLSNVIRRLTKKLDPEGRMLKLSAFLSGGEGSLAGGTPGGQTLAVGRPDDDETDSMLGRVLDGKYELLKFIGGGASGRVYKARHVMMNVTVAVKVLAPQLSVQPDLVRRFEREARTACGLSHRNILMVHDLGVTDEQQPYMVMEFINGFSLEDLIEQNGKLALPDALEIISQVCSGIARAHQEGLVHRDLKPGNIMLLADSNESYLIKIIDFGLAKSTVADEGGTKLTQTGALIGTPSYMSPEQCRAEPTDARSDIYAIGCIFHEMITGAVPFKSSSIIETIVRQVNEPAPSLQNDALTPQLNNYLDAIIQRCLAKEPAARYQDAISLQNDIARLMTAV